MITSTKTKTAIEDAKKAVVKAEQDAAELEAFAAAFNANPFAAELPDAKYIHVGLTRLYGAGISMTWENIVPDEALRIMDTLEPIPTVYLKDGSVSIKPADAVTEKEAERGKVIDAEGFALRVERHERTMGDTKITWYSDAIPGHRIHCTVELKAAGVLPMIDGEVKAYPGGEIISISNCRIVWPKTVNVPGYQTIKYAQASPKYWNPFLLWSQTDEIRQTVEVLAEICLTKREDSRRAYELDKAEGITDVEPPTPRRNGFNCGTQAQHDCLNTIEARMDQALAKKHWLMYIADSNPETWPSKPSEYQTYFEHYAWACHWLFLHGLYVDPNAEGYPNGYKYGSAWL